MNLPDERDQKLATCRHCLHWNDYHMEGNVCKVWMGTGPEGCGCLKWESIDNLLYLEKKAHAKTIEQIK